MAKKSCKKGYYYCFTSEKCKKIPKGWHLMSSTGRIMRDSEHKEEEETKKNGNGTNGNGSGNGDSSGSSDSGGVSEGWSAKYKRSIDCDNPKGFSQRAHCQGRKVNEAKEKGDHEISMAQSQLAKTERNIKTLRKALGKKEKNIPAWLQAKITDTEHNMDAAAGYMENPLEEANKSGDSSLRDWFSKSRSDDGTPGWVQLGGKYAGKPCAKQPGQKTKPKCGSSKMKADLSDKEEESAFRRKNRQDENPNRKGNANNVATEKKKNLNASYSNWRNDLEQLDELKCWKGYKRKKGSIPGEKGSCVKEEIVDEGLTKAALIGAGIMALPAITKKVFEPKAKEALNRGRQELHINGKPFGAGARGLDKQSFEPEGEMVSEGDTPRGKKPSVGDTITPDMTQPKLKPPTTKQKVRSAGSKYGPKAFETEMPVFSTEEKDACYKKVKSRYKIWPSAYASGALVKCRKVGASNWGNKKEGFSDWRTEMVMEGKLEDRLSKMSDDEFKQFIKGRTGPEAETFRQKRASAKTSTGASSKPQRPGAQMPPDFEKQGISSKPRTVNVGDYANRNVPGSAWQRAQQNPSSYRPGPGVKPDFSGVNPTPRPRSVRPNVRVRGGGKFGLIKALAGPALAAGASVLANVIANQQNKNSRAPKNESFDSWKDNYIPTEFESVEIIKNEPLRASDWRTELNIFEKKKDPCKGKPKRWQDSDCDGKWYEKGEDVKEDWQKVNKGDKTDGMSQKAVDAYKRENPGSKLKTAVTEKNPGGKRAKRRKSFCARSKGQQDMHNIDCSKTPDKAICKARKRWRC